MNVARTFLLAVLCCAPCFAVAGVTVEITGVDEKLQKQLLAAVSLHRQDADQHLTEASVKTLFRRADREIRDRLKSIGYYRPELTSELSGSDPDWQASFHVVTGPRVTLSDVEVAVRGDGSTEPRIKDAVAHFPLAPGKHLDLGRYEAGKKAIELAAQGLGFLESHWVEHRLLVNVARGQAKVRLVLDTGPRYRFGETSLPDTIVSPDILEKMRPYQAGDPYDLAKVIAYQQKLRDSNFFREVQVTPQTALAVNGRIPVRVELAPNARNTYRAGVGYGTDTGPRLVGTWDRRYVNRRGHRLEADIKLAPVTSSLTGAYLIPYFRGKDMELGLTSTVSREDTDTSTSNSFQGGLRLLQKRWGWNETLSLQYQYEDSTVAGVQQTSHLLVPSVGYSKSVSDDPVYTRHGFRLSLDLRGTVAGVVSDVTFVQALARAKYITSIGDKARFITRAELGATAVSDLADLPATYRFFAGGDESVRGFDYHAIGPRNEKNEVVGGRFLAVGSVEYEHVIRGNWSGAVFSDFGNAFGFFTNELAYSVGAGIRWRSPVGLIRLDIASGLSDKDHPIRLHLVVGPDL